MGDEWKIKDVDDNDDDVNVIPGNLQGRNNFTMRNIVINYHFLYKERKCLFLILQLKSVLHMFFSHQCIT